MELYQSYLSHCECSKIVKSLEKLHFITLNYTLNYTLYPKLFECIFCTLNYEHCYILQSDIKFSIKLDGNPKFRVQSVIESIV